MKTGIEQIRNVIYDHWKRAGYHGGLRAGQFTKDTAEAIYELLIKNGDIPSEDDMQIDMREEYLKRGGTNEVINVYDRLCKHLGFIFMPLTPAATMVYEWIVAQEKNGQKLETFAKWAKEGDRSKFIKKYKNNPESIMTDWPQVFLVTSGRKTEII